MSRMKKVLACLLAAALMTTSTVSAFATTNSPATPPQTEDQPNVSVDADDLDGSRIESATVDTAEDGTAALKDVVSDSKKKVVIPTTVTVDGVEYKVTTVAKGAFKDCPKTRKIDLPSTVKTIKKGAFKGAKGLETIRLDATPKNMTIAKGAFKGLNTAKMTVRISKKLSKKQVKKLTRLLREAGFKGKILKVAK